MLQAIKPLMFPAKFELMNGKSVEISEEEFQQFITTVLFQNAEWQYSRLLDKSEVMRYLQGQGTWNDLQKISRYILIYQENLALTAYLFAKAVSQDEADGMKEYNLPTLLKLRSLYALSLTEEIKSLQGIVQEMENICREVGSDPL